jgi:hypothetical protein
MAAAVRIFSALPLRILQSGWTQFARKMCDDALSILTQPFPIVRILVLRIQVLRNCSAVIKKLAVVHKQLDWKLGRMTMEKATRTVLRTSLATMLVVVVTGSAGVMAGPPWILVGSDTLAPLFTGSQFTYSGAGSTAVEAALSAPIATQRLAPMGRNFKASVLGIGPGLTPGLKNIVGLDAVVVIEKKIAVGYSMCPKISTATLALVLGGKDGKGDSVSCAHPDRLAAVDGLAACFGGVAAIEHFYRPDDRADVAHIMKEKLGIKRYCNGRAPGLVAGVASNMANYDSDPIRRSCVAPGVALAQTNCTFFPSKNPCTAGQTGCSQGLLISLSQPDPNMTDVTMSIANRVASAGFNDVIGFAGRAALNRANVAPAGSATFGVAGATSSLCGSVASPSIEGVVDGHSAGSVSPNQFNIRANAYPLSYRIFVNWGDRAIGTGKTGGPTADDLDREAEETALYTWLTDPIEGGRFNLDPMLAANGFVPCTDDYSDPMGPGNLCSSQLPPPASESLPNQCIAPGDMGNGTDWCCATAAPSTAGQPCPDLACMAANYACVGSGQGNCCAGLTCTDQGDSNYACN